MLEMIDYIPQGDGALIVRCFGSGPAAELPERIGALAVTALADHCFAKEPSVRIDRSLVRRSVRRGGVFEEGGSPAGGEEILAAAGATLREIRLPSSLRAVGDYAFYGCSSLERILFPSGLVRLGGGAFVDCNHIAEVVFEDYDPGDGSGSSLLGVPPCLREVLAEISNEVEAVLAGPDGSDVLRLVFPGYVEESTENTPARIIEVRYLGTGYNYRQCFRGRMLDLQAYDDGKLFYLAGVNEFESTTVHLAMDRLMTPVMLSLEAGQRYLDWMRAQPEAAADYCLSRGDTGLLLLLKDRSFFTGEVTEVFLKKAREKGNAPAASFLMELGRGQAGAGSGRKYSFD